MPRRNRKDYISLEELDVEDPSKPQPSDVPEGYAELEEWWMGLAQADLDRMLPKVTEYTASDLLLMGQFMEHWLGLPVGTGKEAACVWYALGKVARAVSAYREGRLPSEDTLQDLEIYAKMARRIREKGNWPW